MPRGFLPPASPGLSYPITTPPPADFAEGDADLLSKVGANMAVAEAQTEGRVPSPLSRAYMFYTALFGRSLAMTGNDAGAPGAPPPESDADRLANEGRRALHARARATFRGLCAAFALRDALGLDIALRRIPLVSDGQGLARVLIPNLRTGPGGAAYWQAMRVFTVRATADAGSRPETLAGLSPLTGLFPAAKPPGRALASVFWYDPTAGVWRDPTGPDPTGTDSPLSPQTSAAVRGAIAAWLQNVRTAFTAGSLANVGLDARRESLVRAELDAWASELSAVPTAGVRVVQGAIASEGEPVPAFLLPVCQDVPPAVVSDLGMHQGRLVVTSTGLRDRTRRVWGRLAGHPDLGALVAALPVSGGNLGAALGLGVTAAPTPFVVVDKLFTPRLSLLTQKGLSDEWRALEVANHGAVEHALLPFVPEILELMDPLELAASARAELSQDMHHYVVRLSVGGQEVVQLYSTAGDGPYVVDTDILDNTVDLRVFPNFDLDPVREVLTRPDGSAPDATYYARARLSPAWTFEVSAVRLDRTEGRRRVETTGTVEKRGSLQPTEPGAYPPGIASFFTLPDKPDAFSFGGRGLCVLNLRPPSRTPAAGLYAQDWEIGVDFGTSNTCVAVRRPDGASGPLDFPVFTTTLLRTPTYTALEPVNEGAAATIDFFYKLSNADRSLTPYPYFPTQIFTQQTQIPGAPDGVLDLAAGLIYFLTPSLGTGLQALRLTQGFDVPQDGRPLSKRFRLETDIKWTRREWMGAFMEHLRKQVALSAADQFARITKATFSFPKSFTRTDEGNYDMVLRRVWGDVVQPLVSESEAVRNTLAGQAQPHVVFDIGGGTTDVIGFNGQRPAFQTSFRLAGGQITRYVHASPQLRSALAEVVQVVRPGAYAVTLDMLRGTGATQVGSAWTGLLQSLDDDDPSGRLLANVFLNLAESGRANDAAGRAIRGFFLTNVLLFGGLAVYSGRLLAAASAGTIPGGPAAFPLLGSTALTLTGNGSKLFRAISSERSPFGPVFEALFRLGAGARETPLGLQFNGIYTLPDGTVAAKTSVAMGLLASGGGAEAPIPVANVVGETVDGQAFTSPLVPFYARIRRGEPFVAPPTPPADLAAFLDALGALIPYGERDGFAVIPGAGRDWHLGLQQTLYPNAIGALQERLAATAASLPGSDDDVAVTSAMEPLFIAEIGALIDQVREDYAS
ncbi:MAG TPA: hypothetical protein VF594_06485 [Rubricoccaceae bacterium]|jgi:hypothetical protein